MQVSVSDHGGSWKRMYFERRLWRLVETFVPRLSEPEQLVEMVALGGRFVRRLEISELMPPVIRAADKESADADDSEQTSAGQSAGGRSEPQKLSCRRETARRSILLDRIAVLHADAAYCYGRSGVVCLSVCQSVCLSRS